jgi:N-acyl-D-aspartate/D-glutamate deacylase
MMPFLGYAHGNGDALHEMLTHPAAVLGLADGGAHANFICDASTPTWMLTHWVRDRERGPRLELEAVIKKMTADTAALFSLSDRGVLAPGMRADVNVIDLDRLQLREPRLVQDLPAGGTRLLQAAEGYVATVVAGQVTRENDAFTGARPGRLVRSATS